MEGEYHGMKKQKKKSYIIVILIFLISLLLFQNFVWDEYVVNPTASAALDREAGKQGVLTEINKEQSLGVLKLVDGYRAYALSEGFWGWSITDDTYIPNTSNEKNFVTKRESFEFKGNKKVDVILITTQENEISYFRAYDENEDEISFDTDRKSVV